MKPSTGGSIPPKFWKLLTDEEWQRIKENNGDLDAELCAKLWRMTDYQGEPPQRLQVMFNRSDVMRLFPSKKKK